MITVLSVLVGVLFVGFALLCFAYADIQRQIREIYGEFSDLESELDDQLSVIAEVNRKANHAMNGNMLQ